MKVTWGMGYGSIVARSASESFKLLALLVLLLLSAHLLTATSLVGSRVSCRAVQSCHLTSEESLAWESISIYATLARIGRRQTRSPLKD